MKKFKYTLVFIISLSIFFCGFIKVANELPQIVKDKSAMEVYFNREPFDLKFVIGDYIVFINDKVLENYKNEIVGKITDFSTNNPIKGLIKD